MLYIFHGEDDFSVNESLTNLKNRVGPPDVLDGNISRGDVYAYSPNEVISMCSTIPFLADRRIVIIDGLLKLFESDRTKAKRQNAKVTDNDWLSIVDFVPIMPPTTDLVLVDGKVSKDNVLFKRLSDMAKIVECASMSGSKLTDWIRSRFINLHCEVSDSAVKLMAEMIGGNLWVLSSEVEKLALYSEGKQIEETDVTLLVSYVRAKNVFAMVDALLENKYSEAMEITANLIRTGSDGPALVRPVARQVRLILIMKDLKSRNASYQQLESGLGVASWLVNKLERQGAKYSVGELQCIFSGLLMTDLWMKTSRSNADSIAESLIEVFAKCRSGDFAHRVDSLDYIGT